MNAFLSAGNIELFTKPNWLGSLIGIPLLDIPFGIKRAHPESYPQSETKFFFSEKGILEAPLSHNKADSLACVALRFVGKDQVNWGQRSKPLNGTQCSRRLDDFLYLLWTWWFSISTVNEGLSFKIVKEWKELRDSCYSPWIMSNDFGLKWVWEQNISWTHMKTRFIWARISAKFSD